MTTSQPKLQTLWRDGAIVVETPLDPSITVASIVPGETMLAFRTVIQWDGDIVHRFNPQSSQSRHIAHEAAIKEVIAGLESEIGSALSKLNWCQRGLWAGRASTAVGVVGLVGGQFEVAPLLLSLAEVYVYPLVLGAVTEIGLRWARAYFKRRFRLALDAAGASESQT